MKVDCHQHFWQLERGDYDWLTPDLEILYRNFLQKDLTPHLVNTGVDRTVVVQAAPTEAETEYLLNLAEQNESIAGVVGWVDMESASAPNRLAELSNNPWFKGIRPMIQDIADDNWMLSAQLEPAFVAIQSLNLSFDALVFPRHLNNLFTLLRRYPNLRCVIDHGAKPNIANGDWDIWAEGMSKLAKETNAYCKLSGLLTEAGDNADHDHLKPYMKHLLECFGSDRLMWGSDWPVLELAGDYVNWHHMAREFITQTEPDAVPKVMGLNAINFYRLDG